MCQDIRLRTFLCILIEIAIHSKANLNNLRCLRLDMLCDCVYNVQWAAAIRSAIIRIDARERGVDVQSKPIELPVNSPTIRSRSRPLRTRARFAVMIERRRLSSFRSAIRRKVGSVRARASRATMSAGVLASAAARQRPGLLVGVGGLVGQGSLGQVPYAGVVVKMCVCL